MMLVGSICIVLICICAALGIKIFYMVIHKFYIFRLHDRKMAIKNVL